MEELEYKQEAVRHSKCNACCADYILLACMLDQILSFVYNRNSQGFCCQCSLSAVYDSSIGGDDTTTTRGNLNCDLFSNGLFLDGIPGSAHCMRYADLYYAVSTAVHVNISACM